VAHSLPVGAFQAKYTKAQREAVIRAVIADGLSYGETSRRAARGELEGAGKFTISANYVGKLARPVQQRHEPERLTKEPEAREAIDTARARALVVILSELDAWEKHAAAAQPGKIDYTWHRRIMRALTEHGRTPGAKPQPGREDGETHHHDESASTILAALADAAARNANKTETYSTAHDPEGKRLLPDPRSNGNGHEQQHEDLRLPSSAG
jgi:hypothetical protein